MTGPVVAQRDGAGLVPAHDQRVSNTYVMHYPEHEPRAGDPHYAAFDAYRAANVSTAVCYVGRRVGFDECRDAQGQGIGVQPDGGHGLELHHKVLEFAVLNAVDIAAIEVDWPGLTDPGKVAAFAESSNNFLWLCAYHHRSRVGIHHEAAADFEAGLYVRGLAT